MDIKETSQECEIKLVYTSDLNKAKKEMEALTFSAEKEREGFARLMSFAAIFTVLGYKSCLHTLGLLGDK